MDRRIFLSTALSLPFATKVLAASPWTAKFIMGGFNGEAYQAGLWLRFDKEWKTYWRNPGESGIPPQITATKADNLESLSLSYPLPQRLVDTSGEALGYHNEVLFPLLLKPVDLAKPLQVSLAAFFGVCQQICLPVKLNGELIFNPSSATNANADADVIATWQARVPKLGNITTGVRLVDGSLVLDLTKPFLDIFVDGPARYFFTKPDFKREPGKAWIAIKGLKQATDLQGVKLLITADDGGQGLEQEVTLA